LIFLIEAKISYFESDRSFFLIA